MIYLMSDIHGDCQNFRKLVRKAGITDQDRLIIDGDVIDRGPENLAMLDYCMSHENVTLILGNHEMFMRMYLDNPAFRADWYRFGGNTTLSELDRVSTDRMHK